ncbi:hypothetical protein A2Y83_00620 [Candidatus Falkowbacteria bacterium RBG_13_39_14]|uniref:Ferredoxin n=1 Tax=Candidatus Falkowbacteria bacterium RBG_13_39_14 TaxID=1797985 RepID=A0A1F5S9I7_9BACT|nr:MAG: hypothetical protein A2Y83_00620 [Candidatus Falkowbacteria bacterium RBG_13_39_14]
MGKELSLHIDICIKNFPACGQPCLDCELIRKGGLVCYYQRQPKKEEIEAIKKAVVACKAGAIDYS